MTQFSHHYITEPREPKGIPTGGRWTKNPAYAALDENGQIRRKCYKSKRYGDTSVYISYLERVARGELSCAEISELVNQSIEFADTTRANARRVWDAPNHINPLSSPTDWAAAGATVLLGAAVVFAASGVLAATGVAGATVAPFLGLFGAGAFILEGGTLVDDITRAFGISFAETLPDISPEDTQRAQELVEPLFREAIQAAQEGRDIVEVLQNQAATTSQLQIGSLTPTDITNMYYASLARYLEHMAYYHAVTLPKTLLAVAQDCNKSPEELQRQLDRVKEDFERDCWALP